jgi:hypothetical protein
MTQVDFSLLPAQELKKSVEANEDDRECNDALMELFLVYFQKSFAYPFYSEPRERKNSPSAYYNYCGRVIPRAGWIHRFSYWLGLSILRQWPHAQQFLKDYRFQLKNGSTHSIRNSQ